MTIPQLAAAALTLALAVPHAHAAEPTAADVQKELAALKARIEELEKAQKAAGMTPEQQAELDRITIKAEALEDSRDASGFKGLKLGAWMDPIYQYNADLGRAEFLFLAPVAAEPYGYSASYAGTLALDLQKETEDGTKLRITLMPARSSADVAEALGSIVHEASFSVPLGDLQTRLIGGQIPDWSGYEYLPPTQNKLVSHNLLFDFTLPGFYTGVGLELVRGNWDVKAMVANLNAGHRADFEWAPVLVYRGDYWFTEYSGIGFAGVHGKAPNWAEGATKDTWLDLFEIDGYYTRGALNLQWQIGAGHQRDASITPDPDSGALRDAMWAGASALVSYKFKPRLEGILRGDVVLNRWNGGGLLGYAYADDRNGIGPNPDGDPEEGADRWAVTAGLDYAFTRNATFKLEYRLDGATQDVFRANDADAEVDPAAVKYVRTNHLASTSLVLFF